MRGERPPTGPVPAGARGEPAAAVGGGPLVVWASQTGNAEDFAARLARRLGDSQLVNIDNLPLSRLAAARDVLIVTSTFGDGGPPDNGVDFWDRLGAPDAPALDGVRYAVLGIGDRSYADFCAHARSIDGRLADLGATKFLDRTECEAEPFTRADPVLAPLCRHTVLTAPMSPKEVRQLGFDISEYEVGYAVGDALGVCATNSPAVVDAWLAATGLRGDEVVEVDGVHRTLRDALTGSYDVCRITPDLLGGTQRAGHRRGIHRACRARAMAGGAGPADAAELLDLIEPAGQPARGAADGVCRALPGTPRRSARRGVLDISGRPRRRCRCSFSGRRISARRRTPRRR